MIHGRASISWVLLLAAARFALAQEGGLAGDATELLLTDSLSPFVHRITLYDADGVAIAPDDIHPKPYSPARTCGKCHPYGAIGDGWHFNAARPEAPAGRPGEPWFLVDLPTGTQAPLSYRDWPGAWDPAVFGLTEWEMIERFGRHQPGGGIGERPADGESEPDPDAPWATAGRLEIDCLACHSAAAGFDQTQRAEQIAQRNLAWAPTATAGFGIVRGSTKNLPADFNPDFDTPPADATQLEYDATQFDANDRVFFDVTRGIPAERCYFCHTTRVDRPVDDLAGAPPRRWLSEGDVHLAAGLSCVSCHRNGLDHQIVRGYADERPGDPFAQAFTCAGCHYGNAEADDPALARGGRLGSPRSDHPGIPPLHFEELSCTACHAGPLPGETARRVQTAMAHGLGLADRHRPYDDPPFIQEPVFLEGDDDVYRPYRLMWPSFWGRVGTAGEVTPLAPEEVMGTARAALGARRGMKPAAWQPLETGQIAEALAALAEPDGGGEPVYISGGVTYRLSDDALTTETGWAAAAPYTWPLAHDVRPAAQALGAGSGGVSGCLDCHAPDSPFYFGKVAAEGLVAPRRAALLPMHMLMGEDAKLLGAWGLSFAWRTLLKVIGLISAGVIAVVLALYGAAGGRWLLRSCGRGGGADPGEGI
ncbi:MAG TPA: hypothetical protein PLG73_00070 [Candidatus Sumerlaeota bacterium]|nr:hypothetical protein [Candidatus Sumerlaeota bacterium]